MSYLNNLYSKDCFHFGATSMAAIQYLVVCFSKGFSMVYTKGFPSCLIRQYL